MSIVNRLKGRRMWRWYALLTSVGLGAVHAWLDVSGWWAIAAAVLLVVAGIGFVLEVRAGRVFALALLLPAALGAQESRSGIGIGLVSFGKPVRPEVLRCVRWGWSGGFDLGMRWSFEADEGRWGPYARLTLVPVTSLHVWSAEDGCPGWFSGRPQGRAVDKFGVLIPSVGVQWEAWADRVLLRLGAGFLSVYGGDESWWGGGPMAHLQADLEIAARIPLRGGLWFEAACGGYPSRLWGLEVLHAAAQGDVGRSHGNWTIQLACFGSVVR